MSDSSVIGMTDTTTTDRFPWLPILGLATATLWTVTAEMLPAGLLLDIGRDTGVAPGTVGFLVTAWGLAVAAASLPLTRWTRRVDRRALLSICLLVTGAATFVTALAPTFPVLLSARTVAAVAHGLFWAQVVVVGTSLVRREQATRAVAVIVAGPTVASVVAIPALTALGEYAGWRVAFALAGGLIVASAMVVHRALPNGGAVAPGARARRDGSAGRVTVVAVLGALLLVAHFVSFTYIGPILTGPAGLPDDSVSLALFVFGAAGAVGLLAAPALAGRWPAASLVGSGAALAVALGGLRLAGTNEVGVLVAVGGWGLVLGALPPIFQTRLLGLASEAYRQTAGAVIVVAFNLGVAAGAAAGGQLHDHVGPGPLPAISVVVALAATLGLALVGRAGSAEPSGQVLVAAQDAGGAADPSWQQAQVGVPVEECA